MMRRGIGFPKLSFGVVVHRLPSLGQPPFDQRGIVMAGVARPAPRWRARLGIRSGRRHRILARHVDDQRVDPRQRHRDIANVGAAAQGRYQEWSDT